MYVLNKDDNKKCEFLKFNLCNKKKINHTQINKNIGIVCSIIYDKN